MSHPPNPNGGSSNAPMNPSKKILKRPSPPVESHMVKVRARSLAEELSS